MDVERLSYSQGNDRDVIGANLYSSEENAHKDNILPFKWEFEPLQNLGQ